MRWLPPTHINPLEMLLLSIHNCELGDGSKRKYQQNLQNVHGFPHVSIAQPYKSRQTTLAYIKPNPIIENEAQLAEKKGGENTQRTNSNF